MQRSTPSRKTVPYSGVVRFFNRGGGGGNSEGGKATEREGVGGVFPYYYRREILKIHVY